MNGDEGMIVEMRVYHCAPGRLPALNERFTTITLDFFKKYGIEPIGFWTTVAGPSNQALTYLLRWESLAEREQKWNAFQADPEWIRERAETEKDGQIVANIASSFLTPTSYSSVK